MNKLQYAFIGFMGLMLTGCVSFTPAGPIAPPTRTIEHTLPVGALVKDVQVSDERIQADLRRNIGVQLTSQINTYIERGEYFQKMIVFPGKLGEKDVELTFNFTSLKGKRTPHPGYIPGALLTLTIWIWVNGPIYVDTYDLAGELSIKDSAGKQLAVSRQAFKRDQNTGLWDSNYINFAMGASQLTELVEALLKDATQQLPQQ
ncbi:hypothetical protein ALQ04_02309 [Pseudomonas cichorii]|uniref:Lipoprotein n=1 Tax=Pseudomonas cichorii TaxID=36746 RepID=A0A3M4M9Z7_PSECI|nr:hypothetical protein [Pseudomonas cichorii]RMQ50064.1 hypothetical protein ALQ04_02309 [Pseudomonas cichorii]